MPAPHKPDSDELDTLLADLHGHHPHSTASDTCVNQAKTAIQQYAVKQREAYEIYVPVKNYEGCYEVSNLGNVRSLSRGKTIGRILKQVTRFRNYRAVSLSKDNKKTSYNIHRLVATAFLSNPENKKTVNHKDGNAANNRVENLEWATYSENERHSFEVLHKLPWEKRGLSPEELQAKIKLRDEKRQEIATLQEPDYSKKAERFNQLYKKGKQS